MNCLRGFALFPQYLHIPSVVVRPDEWGCVGFSVGVARVIARALASAATSLSGAGIVPM